MSFQCVDIAVYQPSNASYFKQLRRYGAKGAFIQTNYGTGYPNPRAAAQISNSLKYLDFTGCYAFFLGNPVAEANYFVAMLRYYGMDHTTPVMLDVEANQSYNGPMTALINKWTDIVYRAGYHNIYIYSMGSWLNDGYHIKPENLKHGKIWAAAYGTSEPGVVNTSLWQYTDNFAGLHTDGDYVFIPLSELTGANAPKPKPKPKPKAHKKSFVEMSTYVKKGHTFRALVDINGYEDTHLAHAKKPVTVLKKGSQFNGTVVPCGKKVTRIATGSGYVSGNTKFVKSLG